MAKIEELWGARYEELCKKANVPYPPKAVMLRVYKEEAQLDLWAGEDGKTLKKLASYSVCAMDFVPGPKLREGDKRTPEGRYIMHKYYASKQWFMWIRLHPLWVYFPGSVGRGSAFRLCTDYPNKDDKARSQSIGIQNAGSAICIHGNCTSTGCPSLNNLDFVDVYYFVMQHDEKRYGKPTVVIMPFRFKNNIDLKARAEDAANYNADSKKLGAKAILLFWQELEKIEAEFLQKPSL
ncbi:MAG: hypothetical protein WC966_06355 [Bradymonadales bacterium]